MPVYKDEARGTYYASFYYVDWAGNRKKKKKEGFKKQADAKAFERDFIKKQGGGSPPVRKPDKGKAAFICTLFIWIFSFGGGFRTGPPAGR